MFDGSSGSRWMPRKMAGRLMITIELSSVAMNDPSVVFERAVHLYRGEITSSARRTVQLYVHVNVNAPSRAN